MLYMQSLAICWGRAILEDSLNINPQRDRLEVSLHLRMQVEAWSIPLTNRCQFYA
jgi:hypothetical protein